MKIYSKLVLDIDGNVIEEESVSYEYHGPVAQAMGSRPKPPPPPPPPPAPVIPEPEPEPEPEPKVEETKKQTAERKRRQGRRGLTTGSPLGYDQPFLGNRRSLL